MCDEAGSIHVWNRAAEVLFGYSQNEIKNKSEKDLFWDKNEEVSAGGVRYSWRLTKNDGPKFIKESVVEISDPSGPGEQFMKIIEDNSQAYTPWEQCELWISEYADSANGIFILNAKTSQFQFINKAFANMMNESPEKILGSSGKLYHKLGYHLGYFPKLNPTSSDKLAAELNVNCLNGSDNQPKYLLGRMDPIPNKTNPLSDFEMPLLMISENPEEICLTWFRNYENKHVGAVIVDKHGNFFRLNDYMVHLLGYKPGELKKNSVAKIFDSSTSSRIISPDAVWKNESYTFITKDGKGIKFTAVSIYVRNHNKEIVYTVSLCRPVDYN
jgi:PAS domain S-box-containing protein